MKRLIFLLILLVALIFNFQLNHNVNALNKSKTLQLVFNDQIFSLDLNKYEVSSNIHTVMWEANKFNRKKSASKKAEAVKTFLDCGAGLEESFNLVLPGIKQDIEKISHNINCPSINAKLQFNGNKFKIIGEKEGYELNKLSLYEQILKKLTYESNQNIEIPVSIQKPKFTTEKLKLCTNLRSMFATDYSISSPERKNNIRRAISNFNGLTIYPNETISFNKITGNRNAKNGYEEAKIIVNGKYVPGFGGGVCQASTTLYNACILAGLKCKANNHSIPPSYVSKGLDAMVNNGTSDLLITNNLSLPIYIQTYCDANKVYVKVYGPSLDGYSYKTKTKILEEKPSKGNKTIKDVNFEYIDKVKYKNEIYIKQKATKGYKTATYLHTLKNGKLVKESLLRKDYYPPSEGIIIEGTLDKPIIFENNFENHDQFYLQNSLQNNNTNCENVDNF